MNGHCVYPATDTWAFVAERRPGAVTSAQHKRPSVQAPARAPGAVGTSTRSLREGSFKSNASALFMKTRLLGILII